MFAIVMFKVFLEGGGGRWPATFGKAGLTLVAGLGRPSLTCPWIGLATRGERGGPGFAEQGI